MSYGIKSPFKAGITVRNNDEHPRVSVEPASADRVTEGNPISFTLRAAPPPDADLTVNILVQQTGDRVALPLPQTVEYVAGATSVSVQLETLDNDVDDDNDTEVLMQVLPGNRYVVGSPLDATITVVDDEEPLPEERPRISVSGERSGSTVTFTFTRSSTQGVIGFGYLLGPSNYSRWFAVNSATSVHRLETNCTVVATMQPRTITGASHYVIGAPAQAIVGDAPGWHVVVRGRDRFCERQ